MANKRDSSKQRRARENRARRAALEARTSGTVPKAPSRVAPVTAEKLARADQQDRKGRSRSTSTAGDSDVDDSGSSGDDETSGAKPRRQRPPRPGDRPVDIDTLEGSWFSKMTRVPGGTQVLMAAGLLVVVTLMMSFMDFYVESDQVDDPDATPTLTIFEAEGTGRALLLLGVPVVIMGIALAASLRPNRRRIWLVAAVLIGVLYATSILTYLFVAGFLGYAVLRARKVEGPMEPWLVHLMNRRRGAGAGENEEPDEAADRADRP